MRIEARGEAWHLCFNFSVMTSGSRFGALEASHLVTGKRFLEKGCSCVNCFFNGQDVSWIQVIQYTVLCCCDHNIWLQRIAMDPSKVFCDERCGESACTRADGSRSWVEWIYKLPCLGVGCTLQIIKDSFCCRQYGSARKSHFLIRSTKKNLKKQRESTSMLAASPYQGDVRSVKSND